MNYDRLASAVAAAHETYVADLRSLMFGLRMAGQLTPQGLTSVQTDTHRAMREFLHSADTLATDHLVEVWGGDLGSTLMLGMRMVLLRPLHAIAVGEAQQLQAKIRGSGMGGIIGERSTALAKLAKRADEKFDPTARDSAGRNWQADKLVKFLARDFGYQSLIDARAAAIQGTGATHAEVAYLDSTHENHGLVVMLPLSDEVRAKIFHPNASAQLRAVTHEVRSEVTHVPA
jgi:hypothetical protein